MSISFRILIILSSVSKNLSLKSKPIILINILILTMYCNIRVYEEQYLLFELIGHWNMTFTFERLSWNFNAVPVIFLPQVEQVILSPKSPWHNPTFWLHISETTSALFQQGNYTPKAKMMCLCFLSFSFQAATN